MKIIVKSNRLTKKASLNLTFSGQHFTLVVEQSLSDVRRTRPVQSIKVVQWTNRSRRSGVLVDLPPVFSKQLQAVINASRMNDVEVAQGLAVRSQSLFRFTQQFCLQ